jgi:hypothetical protein
LGAGDALAWVVEMLTTTPTSFAASCAKTSEKGVSCGASARLDAAATRSNVINAARVALQRPKNLTRHLLPSALQINPPLVAEDRVLVFPQRSI